MPAWSAPDRLIGRCLCSAQGTVSLLVFFGSASGRPIVLPPRRKRNGCRRHDSTGVLGFNWAIDPASPDNRTPGADRHGASLHRSTTTPLADSVMDHGTVYHIYIPARMDVVETKD